MKHDKNSANQEERESFSFWYIFDKTYCLHQMYKLDFEKIGIRDQIANICWIIEKTREFRKNIYLCLINYVKAFDCGSQQTGKFLETVIPDHITCLPRNLYAGQEATVRTGHGTKDWFKIGKGVCQGCILSLCLFNLHADYIMWNAGLTNKS